MTVKAAHRTRIGSPTSSRGPHAEGSQTSRRTRCRPAMGVQGRRGRRGRARRPHPQSLLIGRLWGHDPSACPSGRRRPEAITPEPWLVSRNTSRAAADGRADPVGRSSVAERRTPTFASMMRRAGRPFARGAPSALSKHLARQRPRPVERQRRRRRVCVETPPLGVRRGDAVVGHARRDRSLSSTAVMPTSA